MINKIKKITPISLFIYLIIAIMILSLLLKGVNIEETRIRSIISLEGINWYLNNSISEFINFKPLAMIIVIMMGIGLCERTGLLQDILSISVKEVKGALLNIIAVFVGILGNIMSSAAFAIIPPITAYVFIKSKRSPIVGIISSYTGVAAGLSANIFITPTDILLTEISNHTLENSNININLNVSSNWIFMFVSSFVLSILAGYFIYRFIEPKFKSYFKFTEYIEVERSSKIGLKYCLIFTVFYILIIIVLDNRLYTKYNEHIIFSKGFVIILSIWFIINGIIYGLINKKIKSIIELEKMFNDTIAGMSSFIILCFFASQFIAIFNYTNMSKVISVLGIHFLEKFSGYNTVLLVLFIIVVSLLNFFIGSCSAKWIILSPIFLPMMFKLGIEPSITQAAYRIADSVTNCISPLEPFLPFIIMLCNKYDDSIDISRLIKTMFPIAIFMLVIWTAILLIWYSFRLPFGF